MKELKDEILFLKDELKQIKKFASWNNFPAKVRNALIHRFANNRNTSINRERVDDSDGVDVWLNFPYIGPTGERLLKSFVKKGTQIIETQ